MSTTEELLDALNDAAFNLVNHHMGFPHYDEIAEIVRTRDSMERMLGGRTFVLEKGQIIVDKKAFQSCIDKNQAYYAIGTVEHYAELVKAEQDGRIAPCLCGECKSSHQSTCRPDHLYCSRFGSETYFVHTGDFCCMAERRGGK
jgi:hypothetical protein